MTSITLHGADLLTHSRMQTFRTCARKHQYQYELGIRPSVSADFFRLGSAVHKGIEVWSKCHDFDTSIAAAIGPYQERADMADTPEAAEAAAVERETAIELLRGYFNAWAWDGNAEAEHPLTPVEFVASELAFNLPIVNPDSKATSRTFRMAGKIDAIVRLKDGRLAVMEHKTTGDSIEPASDYWTRLRIDHQISLYFVAARALGYDVQTVLYNVIRKPGIAPKQVPCLDGDGCKIVEDAMGVRQFLANGKPRQSGDTEKGWKVKARTETPGEFGLRLAEDIQQRPGFYYARQEIPRLTADLDEFRWELWQQAQAIREAQKADRWIRNSGACLNMGRCPYLSICHNGISPDNLPPGMVQISNIHPELEHAE